MNNITDSNAAQAAVDWLGRFEKALTWDEDLTPLFGEPCYWRDAVAFTGTLHTFAGNDVSTNLRQAQNWAKATDLSLSEGHTPPRIVERNGIESVEVFFNFEHVQGTGIGIVRLVDGPDGHLVARNLMTAIDQLSAYPEKTGENRPIGNADASKFGGPNWLDRRHATQTFEDREPEVLIVGAGQTGLALAARLGQLDVDTLVVDTHERPGDGWRKRYHALTLHNAIWLNDLPYMPFPDTWPVFLPKDKLAGWFESYVDAMEINFAGGTTLTGATYDTDARCWIATLTVAGHTRTLRPRHIVMATGVSGIPFRPALPGLELFPGEVIHSSEYTDSTAYRDKDIVIIGSGNSAHDVAQDLHSSGAARVTMVQRNSTTIVSVNPSAALADSSYLTAPTLDDCDLISLSVPFPDLYSGSQELTRKMRELDKDLIARLDEVGFRTDYGPDDTGQQMKYMTRGGGYYLNVGCSDLLADGEIGLVNYDEVDTFTKDGLGLKSGQVVPADLVVLATGFLPQQESVRQLMGDEIADRVGPIWGYDEEGEVRNMWRPTRQPGLWFSAGNFQMCRIYSKVLALQLRLALDGALEPSTISSPLQQAQGASV